MYPVLEWTVYLIRPCKQFSYLTAEKRVNSVVSLCIHVLFIHFTGSNILALSVLDECYFRNGSRALNLISTIIYLSYKSLTRKSKLNM